MRKLLIFAAIGFSPFGVAQDIDRELKISIQSYLLRHNVPGASVAIFKDGELAWAEGVRWADAENRIPVTRDTLFRLGSISKAVTATATMRLSDDWKLSTKDRVKQYVPEFPHDVTLEQVLSHRSGIRHYNSAAETVLDKRYPTAVSALEVFSNSPLLFKPGTKFGYSTHAYTLLAATLERVTGEAFHKSVYRLVSQPAGATTLRFEDVLVADPNRTRLYSLKGVQWVSEKPIDNSWKIAGGGMESTATDLARFGSAVLEGELLRPETLERMWIKPPGNPYALGWRPHLGPFGRVVEHGGAQQGCRAILRLYRDKGVVIAVMTNLQNHPVHELANEVERVWFGPD